MSDKVQWTRNFTDVAHISVHCTLVNVYVDLVVFTRIAGTSYTGSGGYWCYYYIEKNAICLKDYRPQSFLSIQYVHGD